LSVFLMVIISIDRYLCICHPFTSLINTFRIKVIVATQGLRSASHRLCLNNTTIRLFSSQTSPLLNISLYQVESGNNVIVSGSYRSEHERGSHCQPNSESLEMYKSVSYAYASTLLISVVRVLVFYGCILCFVRKYMSRNKKIFQNVCNIERPFAVILKRLLKTPVVSSNTL
ncbi:hypothetical protein MAR_034552, partial [Mya arenaria]